MLARMIRQRSSPVTGIARAVRLGAAILREHRSLQRAARRMPRPVLGETYPLMLDPFLLVDGRLHWQEWESEDDMD